MARPRTPADIWEGVYASDWERFRQFWWGPQEYSPLRDEVLERPLPERFIEFTWGDVRNAFQMRHTRGFLFVREEYLSLAERLRNARVRELACSTSGCLLLGQPGIGKTYFLLFFLLDCLSRGETVLLTIYKRGTYLFDGWGVAWTATANFDLERQFRIMTMNDHEARIWSLVDWPEENEPIPSAVTYYPEQLFFVAALPPVEGRYDKIVTDHCGVCWWMPPWTNEELLVLLQSLPVESFAVEQRERYPKIDAEAVESLRARVGQCPRNIILWLRRSRESIEMPT